MGFCRGWKLAVPLLALGLAAPAWAQFSPQFNHLKCYQIKDKPVIKTIVVDTQFGRERIVKLTPVLLCAPAKKTCCANPPNVPGCQPVACPADPTSNQPAAVDHFKCYKIGVKTCTDAAGTPVNCSTVTKFAKNTVQLNLRDQFGDETVFLGAPKLLCAPVRKIVVGQTTTTTTTITTTTTTTTTTTLPCHFVGGANPCTGPCPPTAPAGAQCQLTGPGKCDCVLPPVCCECPGVPCFNTTGQCPTNCTATPNSACNASGHCGCGFCRDATSCSSIPCSTSQPCPSNLACDPINCPAPCDPCAQGAACNPVPCLTADGTNSQCRLSGPVPGGTCSCCRPAGGFCTTDFDCCSLICNVSTNTCS